MAHDAAGEGTNSRRTRICRAYSRFPSLKKQEEFRHVFRKGRHVRGAQLHLYIIKGNENANRLGIVVSKKNGNSVGRHRFQRLVKEVFRLNGPEMETGFDIVVCADKAYRIGSGKQMSYRDTEETLLCLLSKANILRR